MFKLRALSACGALAIVGLLAQPAFAQNQPKASQQLKKANEGAQARDHVFDGRKAPPPAVRANTAPKPNPSGQPIVSTSTTPGYKPAPPRMRTVTVPSPVVSRPAPAPSRPAPAPVVTRSTTTATVSRPAPTPTVTRSTTTTQSKK